MELSVASKTKYRTCVSLTAGALERETVLSTECLALMTDVRMVAMVVVVCVQRQVKHM